MKWKQRNLVRYILELNEDTVCVFPSAEAASSCFYIANKYFFLKKNASTKHYLNRYSCPATCHGKNVQINLSDYVFVRTNVLILTYTWKLQKSVANLICIRIPLKVFLTVVASISSCAKEEREWNLNKRTHLRLWDYWDKYTYGANGISATSYAKSELPRS